MTAEVTAHAIRQGTGRVVHVHMCASTFPAQGCYVHEGKGRGKSKCKDNGRGKGKSKDKSRRKGKGKGRAKGRGRDRGKGMGNRTIRAL